MKTYYSLLLLTCITFLGCEKQDPSIADYANKRLRLLDTLEVPVTTQAIAGTWELRHIMGVQVANAPSDFAPGNGYIITFDGLKYLKTEEGKVLDSGTYTLEKKHTEVDFEKYNDVMVLNSDANKEHPEYNWRVSVKIVDDRLLMAYGSIASDGFTLTYQKR